MHANAYQLVETALLMIRNAIDMLAGCDVHFLTASAASST